MAVIRLGSRSEYGELPEVCMRCGAPATAFKDKNFSWHPPWVIVLILVNLIVYAIVALALTKRRRVRVPLCDRHKNHWLWRQFVIVGSFVLLLVVGIGAVIAAANEAPARRGGGDELFGLLCAAAVAGLLLWLVLLAVLHSTAIRPREITDRSIKLAGVAEEFVRAYDEEWDRSADRLDRAVRERWGERGRRPREAGGHRYRPPEAPDDQRPPPDTYQEG
jgi:hypothetical protein